MWQQRSTRVLAGHLSGPQALFTFLPPTLQDALHQGPSSNCHSERSEESRCGPQPLSRQRGRGLQAATGFFGRPSVEGLPQDDRKADKGEGQVVRSRPARRCISSLRGASAASDVAIWAGASPPPGLLRLPTIVVMARNDKSQWESAYGGQSRCDTRRADLCLRLV